MKRPLPVLPCYPCPHGSACCSQGTNLTESEARELMADFGASSVEYLSVPEMVGRGWLEGMDQADIETTLDGEPGSWATTLVKGSGCYFLLRDRSCAIHGHPSYPEVCRTYPWEDPHLPELPMAWDADLCPEMGSSPRVLRRGVAT